MVARDSRSPSTFRRCARHPALRERGWRSRRGAAAPWRACAHVLGVERARARVVDAAPRARGLPREADAAAVEDQRVGQHVPVVAREERAEVALDLARAWSLLGPAEALRRGAARGCRRRRPRAFRRRRRARRSPSCARRRAASTSSASVRGTSPPWRSTSSRASPTMFFAFWLYMPIPRREERGRPRRLGAAERARVGIRARRGAASPC